MEILIGLLVIALGAFCQSSCYVPINKIRSWSWESYWLVQGVFAWLVLPFLGMLLAVPAGHSLGGMFAAAPSFNIWMTVLFGVLWGVGGLTFGLSIALGTCAGLGTVMGPLLLQVFFPETDPISQLTAAVIIGVVVTLAGIAIIGVAGSMKARSLSPEEQKAAVKDFNFPRGLAIALLCGLMSGCFNVGLEFGAGINFGDATDPMFRTLPATFLVTLGGFATNAAYCLWQNGRNGTWGDYRDGSVWANNLFFCILAGALWYSQFFGLALGKGFLTSSPTLMTLSFCILMALNVVFSNLWGIILKEWKGCSRATIAVLVTGIAVLVVSCFLPQLI